MRVERISAGDGKTFPKVGDTITIHYTGTLKSGTKFDSSVDRGQPFSCQIGVFVISQSLSRSRNGRFKESELMRLIG